MHFDALSYCRDTGIRTWTEGKNVRKNPPGWVNVACPLCPGGDPSNHGQFAPPTWDGAPYQCWKCGPHSLEKVVMALSRVDYLGACKLVKQYQTDDQAVLVMPARTQVQGNLRLPGGTGPMNRFHRAYLTGRGFDPDLLEARYGLMGAGPAGEYPHRVIVPVIYQGRMVSWQARDITGRAELRYISASPDREEMFHKDLLYNLDNCRGREVLVVEGITDVWRLGDGCCATFGTKFTMAQVLILSGFHRVITIYDPEPEAQERALKLRRMLSSMRTKAENVLLSEGDPGDLPQEEAEQLKRELLGGE